MNHLDLFRDAVLKHLQATGTVSKDQTTEVSCTDKKSGSKSVIDVIVKNPDGTIDDIYRYTMQLCLSLSKKSKRQYAKQHKENLKNLGIDYY